MKHFTKQQNKEWLAGLPKKSLAVKVIVRSTQGNVLLVKPTYKKSWQLPGGGVEPVPEVDGGDAEHERAERGLVVGADGVGPDLVGHRLAPLAQPLQDDVAAQRNPGQPDGRAGGRRDEAPHHELQI